MKQTLFIGVNELLNALQSGGFLSSQPNSLIEYKLTPLECAASFQVLKQDPKVTAFLKKHPFMASNGIRIAIGEFPEWKQSKNTIYLRGSDKSEDLKVDTTRFVRNSVRNNQIEMFHAAMKELGETVRASEGYYFETSYDPTPLWARNKTTGAYVTKKDFTYSLS